MEEIPTDRPVQQARAQQQDCHLLLCAGRNKSTDTEPYKMTSNRSLVCMFLSHEGPICISTTQSNLDLPRVFQMVIWSLPEIIPCSSSAHHSPHLSPTKLLWDTSMASSGACYYYPATGGGSIYYTYSMYIWIQDFFWKNSLLLL